MRFFFIRARTKKTGGLIKALFLVGGFSALLFYYCPTTVPYQASGVVLWRGVSVGGKVCKMKGF